MRLLRAPMARAVRAAAAMMRGLARRRLGRGRARDLLLILQRRGLSGGGDGGDCSENQCQERHEETGHQWLQKGLATPARLDATRAREAQHESAANPVASTTRITMQETIR